MRRINEKVTPFRSGYVEETSRQIGKNNKKRTALLRRIVVLHILFFTVLGGLVYVKISRNNLLQAKLFEQASLTKNLNSLHKVQESLEREIANLNDDDYISKLARKQYYLSKEGELILEIPETKDDLHEEDQ